MKEIIKKTGIGTRIAIVCNLCILVFGAWQLLQVFSAAGSEAAEYAFADEDMLLCREGGSEPSFYVDYTYDGDEKYLASPEMRLQRGVYEFTTTYVCDDSKLAISLADTEKGYLPNYRIMGDDIEVSSSGTTSYKIYVKRECTAQVRALYQGRIVPGGVVGWAMLRGVSLRYNGRASFLWQAGNVLFWLLAVNAVYAAFSVTGLRGFLLRRRTLLFMLLMIAVFASYPLLDSYMLWSDDVEFHTLRIEGLAAGLKSGSFPVKIQPLWWDNRGYAVSVFYGDLLLYVPAVLRVLQVPMQQAYKFYVFMLNLLTVGLSYLSFRRLVKEDWQGVLCAAVYTFCPYRIWMLYFRTALGEYTALAFFPLVLVGLYEIYKEGGEEQRTGVLMTIAGLSGVLTSHVLSTLMTVLFMGAGMLLLWKKTFSKRVLLPLLQAAAGTLLLNLWFIVPFLDYYRLPIVIGVKSEAGTGSLQGGFSAFPSEWFSTVLGLGLPPYTHGTEGGTPRTVGLAALCIAVLCVYQWIRLKKARKYDFLCFAGLLLAVAMASNVFPYDFLTEHCRIIFGKLSALQYAYRFLSVADVFAVCLFAIFMRRDEFAFSLVSKRAICLSLCLLAVWQGMNIMNLVKDMEPVGIDWVYDREAVSTWYTDEDYFPLHTNLSEIPYAPAVSDAEASVTVESVQRYNRIDMTVRNLSETAQEIALPLVWYPDYRAKDEKGNAYAVYPNGAMGAAVSVPAGFEGRLAVRFREPWYWRAAELISVLTLIGLFCRRKVSHEDPVSH